MEQVFGVYLFMTIILSVGTMLFSDNISTEYQKHIDFENAKKLKYSTNTIK